MGLLLEIFSVVLLLISLWLGIKYLILLTVKHNADRAFEKLCSKLKKQYELIDTLFSQFSVMSVEERSFTENIKNLISQAAEFSIEKDGNERIIGYANSILENVEIFVDGIVQKDAENQNVQKYNSKMLDFNKTKDSYNKSAKILRHYVDVFPTSLMARLKEIKTMDYLN